MDSEYCLQPIAKARCVVNPSNADIRQFILDTFTEGDFVDLFCADYFPQAENDFSASMSFARKVQTLILYCQNRGVVDNLLAALQKERPQPYREQFPRDPHVPQVVFRAAQVTIRNPRQIFISHAHQDTEFAHRLASDLVKQGWSVWITPDSIQPGEKWVKAISRGLDESGICLVVLTPSASESTWVGDETATAIEFVHEKMMGLIPLLFRPCKIPTELRPYQRIDFVESYDNGLSKLLTGLAPQNMNVASVQAQPIIVSTEIAPNVKPANVVQAVDHGRLASQNLLNRIRGMSKVPMWGWVVGAVVFIALLAVSAVVLQLFAPKTSIASPSGYASPTPNAVLTIMLSPSQEATATSMPGSTRPTVPTILPVPTVATNEIVLTLAPGVTMTMVRIPVGVFLMGSTDRDKGASSDEKPQHKVTLDEYLIGKYPVTNAQYGLFARTKRVGLLSFGKVNDPHWSMSSVKENHPVMQVKWDDALAFCVWASQVTRRKVKLPTEAQWEKTARGTDGRIYPWGNEEPNSNLLNYAMNVNDTTAVGKYSPVGDSPYGLADMAGNVWEWTADWYSDTYYARSPASNPQGPTSGQYRVVRGGGWVNGSNGARTAFRDGVKPWSRDGGYGFRVVVSTHVP